MRTRPTDRTAYALVAGVLIGLNLVTFAQAYPETLKIDSGCCAPSDRLLAKDFSAYYTGIWRLIHNPSQIYQNGYVADGEYPILPQPESFKYLPSFLVIAAPLSLLPYQSALAAFDVLQLLLLPLLALMIYRLAERRSLREKVVIAAIVLILPFPIHSGPPTVSSPYYWQWAEGQCKVLEAFLIVASAYLGRIGRPALSGLALGLSFFDPRFAVLALPLFAACNTDVRRASLAALGTFLVSNSPLLLPGVGQGLMGMVLSSGLSTPPYYYSWIPLAAVLCLTFTMRDEVQAVLGRAFRTLGQERSKGGTEAAPPAPPISS